MNTYGREYVSLVYSEVLFEMRDVGEDVETLRTMLKKRESTEGGGGFWSVTPLRAADWRVIRLWLDKYVKSFYIYWWFKASVTTADDL